jgi:hypothetical protein
VNARFKEILKYRRNVTPTNDYLYEKYSSFVPWYNNYFLHAFIVLFALFIMTNCSTLKMSFVICRRRPCLSFVMIYNVVFGILQDDLWTQRTLSTFQTFARGHEQKGGQPQSNSIRNGNAANGVVLTSNLINGNRKLDLNISPSSNISNIQPSPYASATGVLTTVNGQNGIISNGHGSLSSGSPSSVSSNGSPKTDQSSSLFHHRSNGYGTGDPGSASSPNGMINISPSSSGGGNTLGRTNKAKPVPTPTLHPTHARSRSVEGPTVYQNGMTLLTLPGPTSVPIPVPSYHSHSLSYSSMDSDFNMSTYVPTESDVGFLYQYSIMVIHLIRL